MKNELSCEIVRDLLPSFIDELTSKESGMQIKAHLETCADCRAVYEEMTGAEPKLAAQPEIDYLKKVRKTRRGLIAGVICAALAAALILAYAGWRSARPKASWDADTKAVVISGTGNYSKANIPAEVDEADTLDVQDDEFHLSVYIPLLRNGDEPLKQYLPGYIDRTEKSLEFLRDYLKKNASGSYPAERALKMVDINIRENSPYAYANETDRISLNIGNYYWHREELYLLAMMDVKKVEWPQLGYAWYLGSCIDPYNELVLTTKLTEDLPYYDICVKASIKPDEVVLKDQLKLADAISCYALQNGLNHWGTAYECMPLNQTALYTGPHGKVGPNTQMSVVMAESFVGWLDEKYGFENLSAFCFGQKSFDEAFGTTFNSAFAEWSEWILTTYGA